MTAKRKMVTVHVSPFLGGLGWQLKVNSRRVSRFATQQDAYACGVFLAKLMSPSTLKLHGRRGVIKSERTYSRADDPPETPG